MKKSDFDQWFAEPIKQLSTASNTATHIAGMMLAGAVLEAFVRAELQHAGTPVGESFNASQQAHKRLVQLFPDLNSEDGARFWWHVFRNGFLHRLDFQDTRRTTNGGVQALPRGVIAHDSKVPAAGFDTTNNIVFCHPEKFCNKVLTEVEANVATLFLIESPNVQQLRPLRIEWTGTSSDFVIVSQGVTGSFSL